MATQACYPRLPSPVLAKITQLRHMNIPELQTLWHKLYGAAPYSDKRGFLERRLAYRLQEIEFEKHDKSLLQRNKERIQALMAKEDEAKQMSKKPYTLPRSGTVLIRDYQGKRYQVTVCGDDSFVFDGKPYDNLSVIARDITGTRWSGPVFFNLRKTTRNTPTSTARSKHHS